MFLNSIIVFFSCFSWERHTADKSKRLKIWKINWPILRSVSSNWRLKWNVFSCLPVEHILGATNNTYKVQSLLWAFIYLLKNLTNRRTHINTYSHYSYLLPLCTFEKILLSKQRTQKNYVRNWCKRMKCARLLVFDYCFFWLSLFQELAWIENKKKITKNFATLKNDVRCRLVIVLCV